MFSSTSREQLSEQVLSTYERGLGGASESDIRKVDTLMDTLGFPRDSTLGSRRLITSDFRKLAPAEDPLRQERWIKAILLQCAKIPAKDFDYTNLSQDDLRYTIKTILDVFTQQINASSTAEKSPIR